MEGGLVGPEVAPGGPEVDRPEVGQRRPPQVDRRPSRRRVTSPTARTAIVIAGVRRSAGRPTLASSWSPSSTVRRNAAQTASDRTVRRRPDSSSWSAAALVPPGEVTMFRSSAGCIADCLAKSVLPSSVSIDEVVGDVAREAEVDGRVDQRLHDEEHVRRAGAR